MRQDKGQRRFKDPLVLLVKNEVGVALVHKAGIPLAAGPIARGALIAVAHQKRARNPERKLPAASPLLVAEPLLLLPAKPVSLREAAVAELEALLPPQKLGRVRLQVAAEREAPAVAVKVERVEDSKSF